MCSFFIGDGIGHQRFLCKLQLKNLTFNVVFDFLLLNLGLFHLLPLTFFTGLFKSGMGL